MSGGSETGKRIRAMAEAVANDDASPVASVGERVSVDAGLLIKLSDLVTGVVLDPSADRVALSNARLDVLNDARPVIEAVESEGGSSSPTYGPAQQMAYNAGIETERQRCIDVLTQMSRERIASGRRVEAAVIEGAIARLKEGSSSSGGLVLVCRSCRREPFDGDPIRHRVALPDGPESAEEGCLWPCGHAVSPHETDRCGYWRDQKEPF